MTSEQGRLRFMHVDNIDMTPLIFIFSFSELKNIVFVWCVFVGVCVRVVHVVRVYACGAYHGRCVDDSGLCCGVNSLLLPLCAFPGLHSGCQAWVASSFTHCPAFPKFYYCICVSADTPWSVCGEQRQPANADSLLPPCGSLRLEVSMYSQAWCKEP